MTLSLREVHDDDLETFFHFQADPRAVTMAAFTAADPTDRAAFDAHWDRIRRDDTVINRTIVVDGIVVGSVLSYVGESGREISYWIGSEYWGRGYATASLRLYLDDVGERPLFARVAADNTGSRRVLERCGFSHLREMRGFANARGVEIDELELTLR